MRDAVIVGAGPYGLGTAVEAKERGLDVLVAGRPMEFWERSMPPFMIARSPFVGSSLHSPGGRLGLAAWCRATGRKMKRTAPISLQTFMDYVRWYVEGAQLAVRPEEVVRVARDASGTFEVTARSGAVERAGNVVVAVGNPPFAVFPVELSRLDPGRVTHTRDLVEYGPFAGKRVLVVGGGQSALEACFGLLQAGAQVALSHRQKAICWHDIPLRINLPLLHLFIAFPTVLERVPHAARKALGDLVSQPTVDRWLKDKTMPRLAEWPKTTVESAEEKGGAVRIRFSDGRETEADHVVLGTGYRVDMASYPVLDPALRSALELRDGYPVLDRTQQSSVPGLFFNGVPARGRYGPTFNFIFAAGAGARRVVEGLRARRAEAR
jgi:cation diffusion facilitator CzcD-associated flavoprotein CzcO